MKHFREKKEDLIILVMTFKPFYGLN
jgi:hypothetical protein